MEYKTSMVEKKIFPFDKEINDISIPMTSNHCDLESHSHSASRFMASKLGLNMEYIKSGACYGWISLNSENLEKCTTNCYLEFFAFERI